MIEKWFGEKQTLKLNNNNLVSTIKHNGGCVYSQGVGELVFIKQKLFKKRWKVKGVLERFKCYQDNYAKLDNCLKVTKIHPNPFKNVWHQIKFQIRQHQITNK